MAIRLIPRMSDGQFSLSATTFHPSDKLAIYHNYSKLHERKALSIKISTDSSGSAYFG
jgi:hypothetical protein